MSRDELQALSEVLHRRLHNTRDPELQALLWQLTEYSDTATVNWRIAEQCVRDIATIINTHYPED